MLSRKHELGLTVEREILYGISIWVKDERSKCDSMESVVIVIHQFVSGLNI